ncbi:MAG: CDP-alcohol phosphatidyltransferase [Herpetosiphonaceae bacterium]|nr:MAG: CDP-alcohol phosphatidyltransferase [Herpetosiphonaceae bacterium]
MLSALLKARTRRLMEQYVAPIFGRLGLTPNMLTLVGFLLTATVALVLADGFLFLGGWLILAAGIFDVFDGALARATNQQSRFGAFLDSTLDRYAEAVIFFGLLLHYQRSAADDERTLLAALIFASIVGSLLVSYTRARAEGLGLPCEVGLLGRPERIVILAGGLILGFDHQALWILAIFTNITAVQRVIYVWQQERAAAQKLKIKSRKRPFWLARPEE